jgi:uncharacterized protein (DUF362 family)
MPSPPRCSASRQGPETMGPGDGKPCGGPLPDLSRRRFLGAAALAAGGMMVQDSLGAAAHPPESVTSRSFAGRGLVALARGDGVGREPGASVEQQLLRSWLDRMLMTLTRAGSAADAWALLFPRGRSVGIKLNCLAGPRLSPRRELVMALVDGLRTAGLSDERITVWERSDRELRRCGFTVNTRGTGPRVLGTDNRAAGYENRIRSNGSIGSCFSRILTEQCDLLINVGVLKDHDLAGVSVGLKNLYGVIHNPNKYHDHACDPYVADLAAHPLLRQRLRLTICDGTTAQCQGGPAYAAGWAWNYGGLLAGIDPVSVDRVGADVIEARRAVKGLPSLTEAGRDPSWIESAARLGLGEGQSGKIRIREVS